MQLQYAISKIFSKTVNTVHRFELPHITHVITQIELFTDSVMWQSVNTPDEVGGSLKSSLPQSTDTPS